MQHESKSVTTKTFGEHLWERMSPFPLTAYEFMTNMTQLWEQSPSPAHSLWINDETDTNAVLFPSQLTAQLPGVLTILKINSFWRKFNIDLPEWFPGWRSYYIQNVYEGLVFGHLRQDDIEQILLKFIRWSMDCLEQDVIVFSTLIILVVQADIVSSSRRSVSILSFVNTSLLRE